MSVPPFGLQPLLIKVQNPINYCNTLVKFEYQSHKGHMCMSLHISQIFACIHIMQILCLFQLRLILVIRGKRLPTTILYVLRFRPTHSLYFPSLPIWLFHSTLAWFCPHKQLINSSFHFNDLTPNSIPDQSHAPDSPHKLQLHGWFCATELVRYVWSIHALAFHYVTPDNLTHTKDVVS